MAIQIIIAKIESTIEMLSLVSLFITGKIRTCYNLYTPKQGFVVTLAGVRLLK